jgi:alginate O-acetyltransferase complex protein AlgI
MVFNSLIYAVFLPLVFLIYWFLLNKNIKLQNAFIVVVSYIFYGWWDWRFLSLIFLSTSVDFIIGVLLKKNEREKIRKLLLSVSITLNIGLLSFFKYFNFFVDSLMVVGDKLGIHFNESSLKIILPVGISFYTFQALSYTIDVYRRKLEATNDVVSFFAFVSFFPQLVAGPIERATNLLPQFYSKRTFNLEKAKDGLRQILWGLIKKVVIADTLALEVNRVFNAASYSSTSGIVLIIGAIFFVFQIYCDFSGYSDIGIGSARLLGFDLMQNFNYPFFSRNIGEFWQRWHISLSTWFRDYIYVPLGGSRVSRAKQIRNIIITYGLSGFWHGANWTYIIWGLLNGLFYLPLIFFDKRKRRPAEVVAFNKVLPSISEFLQITLTFSLFTFSMVFFRVTSLTKALNYLSSILNNFTLNFHQAIISLHYKPIIIILILVIAEWIQRRKKFALQIDDLKPAPRYIIYFLALVAFIYFGQFESGQQFIYFQF